MREKESSPRHMSEEQIQADRDLQCQRTRSDITVLFLLSEADSRRVGADIQLLNQGWISGNILLEEIKNVS